MLSLTNARRCYLYRHPTDMRKGFDGLSGLVRKAMQQDPLSGDIFLFIGKSGRQIKLLLWEGDGFSIYYKRLEWGTYERLAESDQNDTLSLRPEEVMRLLQGLSKQGDHQRKRFSFTAHKEENIFKKNLLI